MGLGTKTVAEVIVELQAIEDQDAIVMLDCTQVSTVEPLDEVFYDSRTNDLKLRPLIIQEPPIKP